MTSHHMSLWRRRVCGVDRDLEQSLVIIRSSLLSLKVTRIIFVVVKSSRYEPTDFLVIQV